MGMKKATETQGGGMGDGDSRALHALGLQSHGDPIWL